MARIALQPRGTNMIKTRPLNASNEFVAKPKQVIDAKVTAEKKSVFRCRTITHSLAR